MEIKIDPEFRSLIPAITEDELNGLEQSLIDEGCRDALVLWDDIMLDGHNRYEICQKHEIEFKTIVKTFDNRDQAKIWIINNQLARRNLTPAQMSNLRGIRQNLEAGKAGGDQKSNCQNDSSPESPRKKVNIAKKLAQEYGVSESTIYRDAKFAEAVDKLSPEEKKEVLSGKSGKTKKEIVGKGSSEPTTLKDDDKKREKLERSKTLGKLKYYWSVASNDEKKEFKIWIKKEGN